MSRQFLTESLHSIMEISGYEYSDADFNHSHDYLNPTLVKILEKYHSDKKFPIFDLGCGNGSTANFLSTHGYVVSGVDPSNEGVQLANLNFPSLEIELGHSGDNLFIRFGTFDLVYSLEVIEHVFDPFEFMQDIRTILNKGGYVVLSTPFHGYAKNLILSIFNLWDKHFTALWKGGHIKFWSPNSLTQLLKESGFEVLEIRRLGRIPVLAKSMIVVAQKI